MRRQYDTLKTLCLEHNVNESANCIKSERNINSEQLIRLSLQLEDRSFHPSYQQLKCLLRAIHKAYPSGDIMTQHSLFYPIYHQVCADHKTKLKPDLKWQTEFINQFWGKQLSTTVQQLELVTNLFRYIMLHPDLLNNLHISYKSIFYRLLILPVRDQSSLKLFVDSLVSLTDAWMKYKLKEMATQIFMMLRLSAPKLNLRLLALVFARRSVYQQLRNLIQSCFPLIRTEQQAINVFKNMFQHGYIQYSTEFVMFVLHFQLKKANIFARLLGQLLMLRFYRCQKIAARQIVSICQINRIQPSQKSKQIIASWVQQLLRGKLGSTQQPPVPTSIKSSIWGDFQIISSDSKDYSADHQKTQFTTKSSLNPIIPIGIKPSSSQQPGIKTQIQARINHPLYNNKQFSSPSPIPLKYHNKPAQPMIDWATTPKVSIHTPPIIMTPQQSVAWPQQLPAHPKKQLPIVKKAQVWGRGWQLKKCKDEVSLPTTQDRAFSQCNASTFLLASLPAFKELAQEMYKMNEIMASFYNTAQAIASNDQRSLDHHLSSLVFSCSPLEGPKILLFNLLATLSKDSSFKRQFGKIFRFKLKMQSTCTDGHNEQNNFFLSYFEIQGKGSMSECIWQKFKNTAEQSVCSCDAALERVEISVEQGPKNMLVGLRKGHQIQIEEKVEVGGLGFQLRGAIVREGQTSSCLLGEGARWVKYEQGVTVRAEGGIIADLLTGGEAYLLLYASV